MKLVPLFDRVGTVKAWADRSSGWISDLSGTVFALVSFDGVFDRTGAQIGWWYGDYIRDRYGRGVLFRPSTKIQSFHRPRLDKIPALQA
jgi:hypothetical protein